MQHFLEKVCYCDSALVYLKESVYSGGEKIRDGEYLLVCLK